MKHHQRAIYIFMITVWLAAFGFFIFMAVRKESPAPPSMEVTKPTYKIVHIMSYHSPWRWTNGQFNGFKKSLKDLNVEYKVFQMDTKRNDSLEWKEKVGKEARDLIDTWNPDLVYTSDDDAQIYVTKYYLNKDIPFVFSGVNEDPKTYGFVGSKNITGVLEREHFVESVKLLKEIAPGVKKDAAIFDAAPMWRSIIKRMRADAIRLPGVEIISWDVIYSYREYQYRVKEYQHTADALALIGIFNFKDEKGQNVPYQEVLRWTAENSKLPDFSYWSNRVYYGTLCAVTVSEYEQGLAAGKIARGILVEGKSPASFPMKPTAKGVPIVSLARAKKLGIKVKSGVLFSSEVIQKFDWDKYNEFQYSSQNNLDYNSSPVFYHESFTIPADMHFIQKPYTAQALAQKVREVLES